MNKLLNHPLFPHGNELFKSAIAPLNNKLSPEAIIAAHFIDTYATACLARKIPFIVRICNKSTEILAENYSYETLVTELADNTRIIMEGNVNLKDVPYLMEWGLKKVEPRSFPNIYQPICDLSSSMELSNIWASITFHCLETIEEVPEPSEFKCDTMANVRDYVTGYLDELMFVIGDKLIHSIEPVPKIFTDYNVIHLIVKKEIADDLEPFHLCPNHDIDRYCDVSTIFYHSDAEGEFQCDITLLLV